MLTQHRKTLANAKQTCIEWGPLSITTSEYLFWGQFLIQYSAWMFDQVINTTSLLLYSSGLAQCTFDVLWHELVLHVPHLSNKAWFCGYQKYTWSLSY